MTRPMTASATAMATITEAPRAPGGESRSFAPDQATSAEGPHRLLAGERPHGAVVFDRSGERIGVIDDVAIDQATGKPAYAVLHHGGFLGLGRRCRPIPWSLIAYDPRRDGYVTGLDRAAVAGGPSFGGEGLEARDDAGDRERVFAYYARHGAAPYWL